MGAMDGMEHRELSGKIVADFRLYMASNLIYFSPMQILNFWFVPLRFQVLFISFVTLGSTVITSTIESRKVEVEAAGEVEEISQVKEAEGASVIKELII